jgi:eukaryotic-like serine/threonine-protein kinase
MACSHFPRDLAEALCVSALIELRRERPELALALSERAIEAATRGVVPVTRSNLLLTRAESLRALGRTDEAYTGIREARDRVLRIASTLVDAELRNSYLTHVTANARTLQLASAWLGADST